MSVYTSQTVPNGQQTSAQPQQPAPQAQPGSAEQANILAALPYIATLLSGSSAGQTGSAGQAAPAGQQQMQPQLFGLPLGIPSPQEFANAISMVAHVANTAAQAAGRLGIQSASPVSQQQMQPQLFGLPLGIPSPQEFANAISMVAHVANTAAQAAGRLGIQSASPVSQQQMQPQLFGLPLGIPSPQEFANAISMVAHVANTAAQAAGRLGIQSASPTSQQPQMRPQDVDLNDVAGVVKDIADVVGPVLPFLIALLSASPTGQQPNGPAAQR